MDPTPYTNFWGEEPDAQKRAWRPTDESRRKLMQFWRMLPFSDKRSLSMRSIFLTVSFVVSRHFNRALA